LWDGLPSPSEPYGRPRKAVPRIWRPTQVAHHRGVQSMPDHLPTHWHDSAANRPPNSEGGLHAPPGLGFWRTAWWWFDFLILVNLARFRFIAILLVIGLVILKWDLLTAYYEKWTRPVSSKSASSDFEFFCPMHPTVF